MFMFWLEDPEPVSQQMWIPWSKSASGYVPPLAHLYPLIKAIISFYKLAILREGSHQTDSTCLELYIFIFWVSSAALGFQ